MRNCKDCKFWGEPDYRSPDHRTCDAISSDEPITGKAGISHNGEYGSLYTASAFGCVLFESQELRRPPSLPPTQAELTATLAAKYEREPVETEE
jgi:hypothetical protein